MYFPSQFSFGITRTMTGDAILTVVEPGETATDLTIVAPAGRPSMVPGDEGGIF